MPSGIERVNVLRTNSKGIRDSVLCSKSISDYNAYMGGVDKFDQLLAVYNISWKSRRWWLNIFYYMLDCCIINSYICYKEDQKKKKKLKYLSQLNFRSKLANELINNFCLRKRKKYTATVEMGKKQLKSVKYMSEVGDQLPIEGTYRRCAYCSTKQKRSNLLCKKCDKALCKKCFVPYYNTVMNINI